MKFEVPIDVPEGWIRSDALWQRNNPCCTVTVSPLNNPGLQRRCKAILDTGAHNTSVIPIVAMELRLADVNGVEAGVVEPDQQRLAHFTICEGVVVQFDQCPGRKFGVSQVQKATLTNSDVEIIIGRNLLRYFVMTYDGLAGRVFLDTDPRTNGNSN